jgi:uncharacterized alpha-E superfamily protein
MADPLFPRSVTYCINQVEGAVRALPRADIPARTCAAIRSMQQHVSPGELEPAELHAYIDDLQRVFASLNEDIVATWFAPADAA